MHVVVATIVHHPEDARIFHRQIPALIAAGHHVTYVAPAFDLPRRDQPGLTHVEVPRATGRRRLGALRAARAVLRRVSEGADLTIVHDPELLLLAHRITPPRIWDVHEDLPAQLADKAWIPRAARPLLRGPARLVERWGATRFALILAEDAYVDRFGVQPIIRNTPRVPAEVEPVGAERVVYLGRVSEARGAVEMVELSEQLPDGVHLHLMGPVDRTVAIDADSGSGSLTVHGFVPNDVALGRIEGAMAGLSLLHDMPNYRVSLPTKILEYMARGVPVVTTPLPEARSIVERHDCGLIVGFGDRAELADAIGRLHADADLRDRLAANGRRAAAAEYNWEIDAARFVSQCQSYAN
jgi:glycosyltransferase involved in cell wall biosynthesis